MNLIAELPTSAPYDSITISIASRQSELSYADCGGTGRVRTQQFGVISPTADRDFAHNQPHGTKRTNHEREKRE